MRPIQLLLFTLVALALACNIALAQSTAPRPDGGPEFDNDMPGQGHANFETTKQRRIQELNALLQCVQAATNREELRACRPSRPERPQRPPAQ